MLAGGTDLMVEVNEGHRRFRGPTTARPWSRQPGPRARTRGRTTPTPDTLTIGAGVTWREIEDDPLRELVPALAEAARTVGCPQIRNAGTVGGNLATCSPAGDGLPVLAALDAVVGLVSAAAGARCRSSEFMVA